MLRLLVAVVVPALLGCAGGAAAEDISPDYPSETHYVTTSDGYILGVKRIPYGRNQTAGPRVPVFLMHGFTGGSNGWTYLGPEYAIAYNLADAGYDVWMGNARGNKYSRRHVTLNPDTDKVFWNATYEKIAMEDLPAMFDYMMNTTQQDKFHYWGHSQGGTVFLVLNSMSTAYHSKIISANLLSPFGYTKAFPDKALKAISSGTDEIYATAYTVGYVEIKIPLSGLFADDSIDSSYDLFAGASVKQLAHLGQNIRDERFCRYNSGPSENVKNYGSVVPPAYDITRIKMNVTIYCSEGDKRVSVTDALAMANAMPNAVARLVEDYSFAHTDYLTNKEVKPLVTDPIIDSMKNS